MLVCQWENKFRFSFKGSVVWFKCIEHSYWFHQQCEINGVSTNHILIKGNSRWHFIITCPLKIYLWNALYKRKVKPLGFSMLTSCKNSHVSIGSFKFIYQYCTTLTRMGSEWKSFSREFCWKLWIVYLQFFGNGTQKNLYTLPYLNT